MGGVFNTQSNITVLYTTCPNSASVCDVVCVIQVSRFTPDTTSPSLVSYVFDLDNGLIHLVFSETVESLSFVPTQVTVANNITMSTETQSYTLRGSNLTHTFNDSTMLTLKLDDRDLNSIKYRRNLATTTLNTFVRLGRTAVYDMNRRVYSYTSQALGTISYIPDTTDPYLIGYDLDVDAATLTMTFSELIDPLTVRVDQLSLQSDETRTASTSVLNITAGNVTGAVRNPGHPPVMTIDLLPDINQLKFLDMLSVSNVSTYLTLTTSFLDDMAGQPATQILASAGMSVDVFTADTTQPQLANFNLNLTSATLTLLFDETVRVGTIDVSQITLQDQVTRSTHRQLTNSGVSTTANGLQAVIALSRDDLDDIKLNTALCTTASNCYITITGDAFDDMAGNNVTALLDGSGKIVNDFYEDFTPPTLLEFELDMDNASVKLLFSEPVNVNLFNISDLVIQASRWSNTSLTQERLTPGAFPEGTFTSSGNGIELFLQLGTEDLYNLQRKRGLATGLSNTYITMASSTIKDMNNLLLVEIPNGNASQVTSFAEDISGPVLLSFDLDMDSNMLNLTWDEVVDVATLQLQFIYLQSLLDAGLADNVSVYEEYQLTSPAVAPSNDSHIVIIRLSDSDAHEVKLRTNLATTSGNTVLRVTPGAIKDLATTPRDAVTRVRSVSGFLADTTSPNATTFTVDLNTGRLIINFNEPVDVATIDFTQLTLSEVMVGSRTNLTLRNGSSPSSNGLQVVVVLTDDDLNDLKRDVRLHYNESLAYMSLTPAFIRDMLNNSLTPYGPQRAAQFDDDINRPALVNYVFDNDAGIVTLLFNETVDVSTLEFNQLTFQSMDMAMTRTESYTLRAGTLNTSRDDVYVHIVLDRVDHDKLKQYEIGNSKLRTYLVMPRTVLQDMKRNDVYPLVNGVSARNAESYIRDETSPALSSFWLDLTAETLTLSFSETVRRTTLVTSEITLYSSNDTFQLTASSTSSSSDGAVLVVDLSLSDLNEIKRKPLLGTSVNNTAVLLTSLAVRDMVGNDVTNITADMPLSAANVTGDTTNPKLNSFELDLTAEELRLHFSETVNASSLNVEQLTFQSMSVPGINYTLTGGTVSNTSHDLVISLTEFDLNEIKKLTTLATMEGNTFLALTDQLVLDMAGNRIVPIADDNATAIQPGGFTADSTNPQMRSFNLSMDSGILTLSFSETVNVNSLLPQRITLLSRTNSTVEYTIMSGTRLSVSGPIQMILLSQADLNAIKEIDGLAVSMQTTSLFFSADLVEDMTQNQVADTDAASALDVTNFSPDETRPSLVEFHLDMDEGILWLTWNETMRSNTTRPELFSIQNEMMYQTNVTVRHQLRGGNTSEADSTVMSIVLLDDDVNELKRLLPLAVSANTTYLSFPMETIDDMNNNRVYAIANSSAREAANYTQDLRAPRLQSFSVNMTSGVVELVFSETIAAASFDVSQLVLHTGRNPTDSGYQKHELRQSTTLTTDGTMLRFRLSLGDLDRVKFLPLGTNVNDTFITLSERAVNDTNNNRVQSIALSGALKATSVAPDETPPELLSFNFDISAFMLTLSFSETVQASSINVTGILFQAAQNASAGDEAEAFRLTTSSSPSTVNNPIIVINVSVSDMNEIKRLRNLSTSENDTYISVNAASILDMNNNPLVAIPTTSALQVSNYSADIVPPRLVTFDLIMVNGKPPLILEVEFDETVLASSLDPRSIILANSSMLGSTTYKLTGGEVRNNDSTRVQITLTATDLEAIRQLDSLALLTQANTSYLYIEGDAIQDMANNNFTGTTLATAVNIRNGTMLQADLQPPSLVSYTMDLNHGLLYFQFSEPVDDNTTIPQRFVLLNARGSSGENRFPLTGAARILVSPTSSSVQIVEMTANDLNELKKRTELFVTNQTAYVAIARGAVRDFSENEAVVIEETAALKITRFTQDSSSPRLLSFDVDLVTEIMQLTFSETVNASSLDITQLTFQNTRTASSVSEVLRYTLRNSFVWPETSDTVLNVNLTEDDLNAVKQIENLVTEDRDTFLYLTAQAIRDMAQNLVTAVSSENALNVTEFVGDMTRPRLRNATLDLDTSTLILTYDETVKQNTFDIREFTLQDGASQMSFWRDINAAISSELDSPILSLRLSDDDVNEVKRIQLCTMRNNCFLAFTNDSVRDMARLQVVAEGDGSAHPIDIFVPDTTPPQLLQFVEFDLMNNTITLSFDETVDVSTIDFTQIQLQSLFEDPLSQLSLSNGTTPSRDTPLVVISLPIEDVDRIKLDQQVCTRRGTCYLTATSATVMDMNGNNMTAVVNNFPGRITQRFIADRQAPRLEEFDLSLQDGRLVLIFDEPVLASSLDVSAISLQASANTSLPTEVVTLSGGQRSTANGRRLEVTLSANDLRRLKSSMFVKNSNTTYLSFSSAAVTDMSFIPNQVVEIPSDNAWLVRNFTKDEFGPKLDSFVLDLDDDQLSLTFNEPVEPGTFNVTAFSLRFPSSMSYDLLDGKLTPASTVSGLTQLVVNLQRVDLRPLKLLAVTNTGSIALATTALGLIQDTDDLLNQEEVDVRGSVVHDTSQASLESFVLDVNSGLLLLTFDDVMLASVFDVGSVIIQSKQTRVVQEYVALTQSSSASTVSGYSVNITLGPSDLNRIKSIGSLGTNINNTYLTARASAVDDVFRRDVLATTDTRGLKASMVYPDVSEPFVDSFHLDLNQGTLTITFSETVLLPTFQPEGLSLVASTDDDSVNASSTVLRFTADSTRVLINMTIVEVTLTSVQLDQLKANNALGVNISNTRLTIDANTTLDTSQLGNLEVNGTLSIPTKYVVNDTTAPRLLQFDLDMDVGNVAELTLFFSEAVDASSLNTSRIAFHGSDSRTMVAEELSLTGGDIQVVNLTTVIVTLLLDDVNRIKQLTSVATGQNDTYLYLYNNSIQDESGNWAQPIPFLSNIFPLTTLQVLAYGQDTVQPVVRSWLLDMTLGTLTFSFSETVRASSINMSAFTVHSSYNDSMSSYTLADSRPISQDAAVIVMNLSSFDLDNLRVREDLAISQNTSYLSWRPLAAYDMSRRLNSLVARYDNDSLEVSNFTADSRRPTLVQFVLDLNTSIATFSFSEIVRASTFDVTQIVFRNLRNQSLTSHRLTTASEASVNDSTLITVSLSEADLNIIKRDRLLATAASTTYLEINSTLVQDMNYNWVQAITETDAHPVDNFIPDRVDPVLRRFSIDMTELMLSLTFSETVRWATLYTPAITIQNLEANPTESVQLQMGTVSQQDSTVINIQLSVSNSNELKRLRSLAVSNETTYISITELAVKDMNFNNVSAILPPQLAIGVTNFTDDSRAPELDDFTLDMNAALLILTFSETVNASALRPEEIVLQGGDNSTYQFVAIANGTWSRNDSVEIRLTLSHEDDNAVKAMRQLAKALYNTYISFSTDLVRDMNGNAIVRIPQDNAKIARDYKQDRTRPYVTQFNLDLNTGRITLSFSETVDIRTFYSPVVALQEEGFYNENVTRLHLAPGAVATPNESDTMIVQLTKQKWDQLRIYRNLATFVDNTFLFTPNRTVQDMSLQNNSLHLGTTQVTNLTLDSTPPSLIGWDVDIASQQAFLTLSFDEPVETDSFNATSIRLQTSSNFSTDDQFYTLTGGSTESMDGLYVIVQLTQTDLNAIKFRSRLLVDEFTSYISIDRMLVDDMNGNPVRSVDTDVARITNTYFNDTTRPVVTRFHLDMDSRIITLEFIETMNASSVNMSGIVLQSHSMRDEGNFHRLTGGRSISMDSTVLQLEVTVEDMNELKRLEIGRFRSSSFIVLDSYTVRDMNDHPLRPVTNSTMPLPVRNYTSDTTRPNLRSWRVDLSLNMLWMTFDETVNPVSLETPQITIQNTSNVTSSTDSFVFTKDSATRSFPNTVVRVDLGTTDLNQIKRQSSLLVDNATSFLYLTNTTIYDMFANPVVPISNSNASEVRSTGVGRIS